MCITRLGLLGAMAVVTMAGWPVGTAPPPSDPEEAAAYAAERNIAGILAPLVVFHVLALAAVAGRVYGRVKMTRSFGRDDAVMVAAAVCALGGMITFFGMAPHGLGRHVSTISHDDMVQLFTWDYGQTLVAHLTALGLLKTSIALSLLRLSQGLWFRRALYALIVFVAAYTLIGWFSFLLRCFPLRAYLDPSVPGSCYPMTMFIELALTNTAFNIFTDVCFATLPIPVIWKLQMRLRTRIYLVGIFSLGYTAVGMGVAKAVAQLRFTSATDRTFTLGVEFWGFLQINVGIIAACAPTLKAILGNVLGIHPVTPPRDSSPSGGMPNSDFSSTPHSGSSRPRTASSRAAASRKRRAGLPDMRHILNDDDDDIFEMGAQFVGVGNTRIHDLEAGGGSGGDGRGISGSGGSSHGETSPTATTMVRGSSAGGCKSGAGSEEMVFQDPGGTKTTRSSMHSNQ